MDQGGLFSVLRGEREGEQFEKVFRLLFVLFHAWCSYRGDRKPCGGEAADGYLRAIYFDKFVMVVFRLWDACFQQTGRHLMLNVDEASKDEIDGMITFPCPLKEVKGKHGRGRARYEGKGPPVYAIKILYDLQQEGLLAYFDIRPPEDDPKNPTNYRTTVRPGLPTFHRPDFVGVFTSREKVVIDQLGISIRRLGPSHIRALGTHENRDKMLEDVEKELRDSERLGLWERLIEELEKDGDFFACAEDLHEYAYEALRKSVLNREDYEEARGLLETEINDHTLKEVFLNCQRAGEEIWNREDEGVRDKTFRSKKFYALTCYLAGLSYFGQQVGEREVQHSPSAKERKKQWQSSRAELASYGFDGLPRNLTDCFQDRSRSLRNIVRRRLLEVVRAVREQIRV